MSMEFSRQEYWCGLPFPSPYICVYMCVYIYIYNIYIIYVIYILYIMPDFPLVTLLLNFLSSSFLFQVPLTIFIFITMGMKVREGRWKENESMVFFENIKQQQKDLVEMRFTKMLIKWYMHICCTWVLSCFNHVQLFATLWTVAL